MSGLMQQFPNIGSVPVPGSDAAMANGWNTLGNWTGYQMPADMQTTINSQIAQPSWNSMKGVMGYYDPVKGVNVGGWAPQVMTGINSALQGWLGMKNYGLARDQLKFQKGAFNQNFAMQKKMINNQLEGRARDALAGSPGTAMSVEEYMKKYGV